MFEDILNSQSSYWWFDIDFNVGAVKPPHVFDDALKRAIIEKVFVVEKDPSSAGAIEVDKIIGEITDYRIYSDKLAIQVKIYQGKTYDPNAKLGFRCDISLSTLAPSGAMPNQSQNIAEMIIWCFFFK